MPGPPPSTALTGRGGTPTGPVGLTAAAGESWPSGDARSRVGYEVKFDGLSH
jgi:hypothetical protein